MLWGRKRRGNEAEQFAEDFLRGQGFRILERNLAIGGGEIDIVAEEGGVIVFAEVKARRGDSFGSGAEAVTGTKASRIVRAARACLASRKWLDRPCRCDLLAVELDEAGRPAGCAIYRDCIDMQGALAGRRWQR